MDPLDYWRLCDELSVVQAALLIVGKDRAQSQEYVDGWVPKSRPLGYDAARAALVNAISGNRLKANIVELESAQAPDWHHTTIPVEDLKGWLRSRGIPSGFFFSKPDRGPDYLVPWHPHYSPKLAAAIESWNAISADDELRRGKSVKQALMTWLRKHADRFDLTKDDGNPNEQGIEEVAKIANWDMKGGAPKTPR